MLCSNFVLKFRLTILTWENFDFGLVMAMVINYNYIVHLTTIILIL